MVCEVMNCIFNNDKECETDPLINENGFCSIMEVDDCKCHECGSWLISVKQIDNETRFPGISYELQCPNGC